MMIVTIICLVTGAVFLWRGDFNAAFVVAVVGLVTWFLRYRSQARESLAAQDNGQGNDQESGYNSDQD